MKTHGGTRSIASSILTSTLDGGEWSASRPGRFTPRKEPPVGGWVGRRAGLRAVEKNLALPGIEPRPSLCRLSYPDPS
jgi:hypothetical protein